VNEQQVIDVLTSMNTMLVMLIAALIGGVVVLLSAIGVFIVGWNLRQDRQGYEQGQRIARLEKSAEFAEYLLRESIPELYEKWDSVVTGRVPTRRNTDGTGERPVGRPDVLARSIGSQDGIGRDGQAAIRPETGSQDAQPDCDPSGDQAGTGTAS
jgi:hypothetical protein